MRYTACELLREQLSGSKHSQVCVESRLMTYLGELLSRLYLSDPRRIYNFSIVLQTNVIYNFTLVRNPLALHSLCILSIV